MYFLYSLFKLIADSQFYMGIKELSEVCHFLPPHIKLNSIEALQERRTHKIVRNRKNREDVKGGEPFYFVHASDTVGGA